MPQNSPTPEKELIDDEGRFLLAAIMFLLFYWLLLYGLFLSPKHAKPINEPVDSYNVTYPIKRNLA